MGEESCDKLETMFFRHFKHVVVQQLQMDFLQKKNNWGFFFVNFEIFEDVNGSFEALPGLQPQMGYHWNRLDPGNSKTLMENQFCPVLEPVFWIFKLWRPSFRN